MRSVTLGLISEQFAHPFALHLACSAQFALSRCFSFIALLVRKRCTATTQQECGASWRSAPQRGVITVAARGLDTTVKGDNDDVTEADVRAWMESADVDELLKGGIDLEEIEERELPEMKIDEESRRRRTSATSTARTMN